MPMIAFEEIADGVIAQRLILRFDADPSQNYGLIDYYCTHLSCSCDEADVRLHALADDAPILSFRIPFDGVNPVFDDDSMPGGTHLDATQRAIAEELASDANLREVLAQRRQAVRANAAAEQKRTVVRYDGTMYGFGDFLGPAEGRPMYFSQGSLKLGAVDRACIRPTCDCMEIVLSFFEVDQVSDRTSSPVEPTLDVRLDLASREWSRFEGSDPFAPRERAIMEDFKRSLGDNWPEWLQHRRKILRDLGRGQLQFFDVPTRAEATPGRNEPCPCGSNKKYKKCHGRPGQVDEPSRGSESLPK